MILWFSTIFDDIQRYSIIFNDAPRQTMILWYATLFHDALWYSTIFHYVQWRSKMDHDIMIFHAIPRYSTRGPEAASQGRPTRPPVHMVAFASYLFLCASYLRAVFGPVGRFGAGWEVLAGCLRLVGELAGRPPAGGRLAGSGWLVDIRWYSTIFHNIQWRSKTDHDIMTVHAIPCFSMIFHNIQWHSKTDHDTSIFMRFHDIPSYCTILHYIQWRSKTDHDIMVVRALPRYSMIFHAIP